MTPIVVDDLYQVKNLLQPVYKHRLQRDNYNDGVKLRGRANFESSQPENAQDAQNV